MDSYEYMQEQNRQIATFRDLVIASTGKTIVYGTADFLQGYEDGRAGKDRMAGRKQFGDNRTRKDDYTKGYSEGASTAMWETMRRKSDQQLKVWAERETLKAMQRQYGNREDEETAWENLLTPPTGPWFPKEG